MFTLTKMIFFGLIDVILSVILIGIGVAVIAVIIFLLYQFIKAMFIANNHDNN